jgi:hypothetical protein
MGAAEERSQNGGRQRGRRNTFGPQTFAYHAYRPGADITLLMRVLNHSAPSVTLRYIGITQDQVDDVFISTCL